MKKQIKLIKVLSIAMMLSTGTAMVSFAESGWVEENGSWAYCNEYGERVTCQLLELDGDYYYIGEDGLMVRNQWIAIDNEFVEVEGGPEKYWYYFQDNGKACRRPVSGNPGSAYSKEINGYRYSFDTEGRMLYGWVRDGERLTEEDAWKDADYYFGTENDGTMKFGWQKIPIHLNVEDEVLPSDDIWQDGEKREDERTEDRWFYFYTGGKKARGTSEEIKKMTIDGQKYGFDQYGRMVSRWYADPTLITLDAYDKNVSEEENLTRRQGGSEYTKEFMYFGAPESGIQYKKGWFQAVPSLYLMESKHLDGSKYTYFADEGGHICANEIRTIDGEKYAFDNYGRQIRGFVCLIMEDEKTSSKIETTWFQDKTDREFNSTEAFEELIDYERYNSKGQLVESYRSDFASKKMRFYYFNGKNGEMLTGRHIIKLKEGGEVEFFFEEDGRYRGSGVFGKRDNKLYQAGMLLKASEEEKYAIVRVENKTQMVGTTEKTFETLDIISRDDFIDEVCNSGIYDEDRDETVWTVRYEPEQVDYYLINMSGAIINNKKNAIDGEGYRFIVKNGKIQNIVMK